MVAARYNNTLGSKMSNNKRDPGFSFVDSPLFQKLQIVFWVVYIALPIFTGWFAYDWLPNESFDEQRHVLLEAHEVSNRWTDYGEIPDMWRDIATGITYTPSTFAKHRNSEAKRIAVTWFAYGILGCFFFAYVCTAEKRYSFYEAFGKAALVNLALATYAFIHYY
jgi:hypothetical protein